MEINKVFVYGTLMTDMSNHHFANLERSKLPAEKIAMNHDIMLDNVLPEVYSYLR